MCAMGWRVLCMRCLAVCRSSSMQACALNPAACSVTRPRPCPDKAVVSISFFCLFSCPKPMLASTALLLCAGTIPLLICVQESVCGGFERIVTGVLSCAGRHP